jgi:hypothetical protein
MLAVKRGVIWQVGHGSYLGRMASLSVLADPQAPNLTEGRCGEVEDSAAQTQHDVGQGCANLLGLRTALHPGTLFAALPDGKPLVERG